MEKGWWSRITAQPQKPAWLKIDFDRWQSDEDLNDDEDVRDVREDYPDLYNKLQKEEIGYRSGITRFFLSINHLYILYLKHVNISPKQTLLYPLKNVYYVLYIDRFLTSLILIITYHYFEWISTTMYKE